MRICDDVISGAAGALVAANNLQLSAAFLQVSDLSTQRILKGLLAFMFSCPQAGCQRVCSHTHVGEVAEVIRSCKPS